MPSLYIWCEAEFFLLSVWKLNRSWSFESLCPRNVELSVLVHYNIVSEKSCYCWVHFKSRILGWRIDSPEVNTSAAVIGSNAFLTWETFGIMLSWYEIWGIPSRLLQPAHANQPEKLLREYFGAVGKHRVLNFSTILFLFS